MPLNEIQISRLLDTARKFAEQEKHLHAAQYFLRLMQLEPQFLPAYLELASLYADMDYPDAAIGILQRAENNFPGDPEVLFRLGDYYLRDGRYRLALKTFTRLEDEKSAHVHYKMGVAYFFQENLDEAEHQFRIALKINPHFPRVNDSIGELLLKRGMYGEAIRYLRKGIALDPYNGVSHFLLGLAHCRLDKWPQAYDEFVLAIDMDPQESVHWQLCGETLIHLRRLDEAEQYIRKALELDSKSVDSHILFAQLHAIRGNYDRSMEFINQALALEPRNPRAKELLWRLRDSCNPATTP